MSNLALMSRKGSLGDAARIVRTCRCLLVKSCGTRCGVRSHVPARQEPHAHSTGSLEKFWLEMAGLGAELHDLFGTPPRQGQPLPDDRAVIEAVPGDADRQQPPDTARYRQIPPHSARFTALFRLIPQEGARATLPSSSHGQPNGSGRSNRRRIDHGYEPAVRHCLCSTDTPGASRRRPRWGSEPVTHDAGFRSSH